MQTDNLFKCVGCGNVRADTVDAEDFILPCTGNCDDNTRHIRVMDR